ncbi:predicted protein [Pyrenophora tritici-repentis Pt-1C-BFP]|uniref:Uncharacterized protein n=1 Tax=Pyrenophora tritici-repentis (strain Pt-1C-BFP) TaxID=426418 RepID=B2WGS9_PYRTR|nr:uncharacterized protein PTRG_09135 [Pyrenophora tritici-repentis Pt-1C-BFP]EDU42186.1 predicted protein [Pyrenophora tritici-repentis Pt-1C-BFP]
MFAIGPILHSSIMATVARARVHMPSMFARLLTGWTGLAAGIAGASDRRGFPSFLTTEQQHHTLRGSPLAI